MKQHHDKHKAEATPADEPKEAAPAAAKPEEAAEQEALQTRLLRLQADFDNFRKRTARERIEFSQRATEDLMTELLPVLDHYELGLKTAREHKAEGAIVDGFQMVFDQLLGALKKAGLSVIEVKPGDPFNPHLHEAVTHLPSESIPEDAVVEELRKGYTLGERLLRAAKVIVSSGPETADVDDMETATTEETDCDGGV